MSTHKTELQKKADFIREEVIAVAVANGAGHIAPSLSCVDILAALYYKVMNYDGSDPLKVDRDRFILSKSHGCYGFYAILADVGLLPTDEWKRLYQEDSQLLGCAKRNLQWGIEAGCGSLGHGLPMAAGMALAAKQQDMANHVFCLVGDGEMQEGTNWEAIQFAVKHELGNLTIIIDNNQLQAMDFIVNILDRTSDDLVKRLAGFGLAPQICPGHNATELAGALAQMRESGGITPKVLVAETIKGYGLKCMESVPRFHFRIPTDEEIGRGRSHG